MTAKPRFIEREPHEKGFAEVFADEIAPKLHELELSRIGRWRETKMRAAAVAAASTATGRTLRFDR